MAHWRHLAPPPDTGHSVWAQEGRRGVEGAGTHPLPPRPGRHRQRQQLCGRDGALNAISVLSFCPTLPLSSLTPVCGLNSVCVVTLLGVVLSGFSLPISVSPSELPHLATSHKEQHNSLVVLALLLRREIQGPCCHTLPPSPCLCPLHSPSVLRSTLMQTAI